MSGVRHVVTLTFREDIPAEQLDAIVTALHDLPDRIPELRDYVVGLDLGRSDGNATLGIVGDFDDWAGYEVYRDHPDHVAIARDLILPILTARGAVQHELP